jgi:DNA polymerase
VGERDELREIAGGLRRNLEQLARMGVYGVPAGSPAVTAPPAQAAASSSPSALMVVREALGECVRCKLHTTRKTIVFGVGADQTALMFVGEAPGAEEDRRGEPFVGAAGQLLDKMIAAMGWSRETVHIANVLKCRPPGNRDPDKDEVEKCFPFLVRQIEAIKPRIIVALGKPAAHALLSTTAPISTLRGRFHEFRGVKVMPTFHPAFLLRDPNRKRDAWSDLKQVIDELERLGVQTPHPPKV